MSPDSSESNYPRVSEGESRQNLVEVASGQRQVVFCVLGQLAIAAIDLTAGAAKIPALGTVSLVLALGVLVFMIVSVLRLAKALMLPGVLYAILMIVPCVSLFVLLYLSGKATAKLRAAGIKVGFLGADPNSI